MTAVDHPGDLPVGGILSEQEWAIICAIRSRDSGRVDGTLSDLFYRWAEGTIWIGWNPVPSDTGSATKR